MPESMSEWGTSKVSKKYKLDGMEISLLMDSSDRDAKCGLFSVRLHQCIQNVCSGSDMGWDEVEVGWNAKPANADPGQFQRPRVFVP